MAQQLSFDLPVRTAMGREDFFVSSCNALALAMLDRESWPNNKLILAGPSASGKTHLAHLWATECGGAVIASDELGNVDLQALHGPIAVDDVPSIAGRGAHETALFHLHNLLAAEGRALLLTGVGEPRDWGITLPDLNSRLQGAVVTKVDKPDDALLMAVMAKMFSDRQMMPSPDLLNYLITRIERSFAAARQVVIDLDLMSLREKKPITRTMATRLLS